MAMNVKRLDRVSHAERRRGGAGRSGRPTPLRPAGEVEADPLDQALDFIRQLADAFNPEIIRDLQAEIDSKMRQVPLQLNGFGYDPWGLSPAVASRVVLFSALFYRYYFRAQLHGIEHMPRGRVMLIANHAGQVAIDAMMIGTGVFLEGTPPRILRGMGEYWLPTVPWVSELMARTGSVVGTPKNCTDLLERDEAVIAFPEGVRGMNKLYADAYHLQRFGLGFMRLAIGTNTPIVPVAVIGSEEQAPAIANLKFAADILGMPAFPVTLTWPWLGPLGMIPFPVKYRIHFGKPMQFDGNANDEDEIIEAKVQKVKDTIQFMLDRGLRQRSSIFF